MTSTCWWPTRTTGRSRVGPSSLAVLQPGMVISIDIPMFNTDWGGLRVESGYLVTE